MSETQFDVFLSHTSLDKPTIERIAAKLGHVGIRSWLDTWCLTPGGRWQDEIVDGIHASRSFAVFVGPHGIGDWVREELALAKDRAAKDRSFRLFPVLLPGLPDPFDPTSLPPFLSTHTWVDLRAGYENDRVFQRLINAIHGIPQGSIGELRPAPGVCPYRGLEAFDEAHAEFFFGREADVQRLIEHVKANRFLAVIGPSGSGKSSLVRAGLIPALREGRLPDSETWMFTVFRPGARPLAGLAAQLTRLIPQHGMQATLDGLSADARSLHLAAELALIDAPVSARLMLVVDQFEELFTLCQDDLERNAFLDNLLYAASIPGGRCTIVLSMRADFYARCAAFPALASKIAARQYLVTPVTGEALRAAIVQPAWCVGLDFEDGLVETITADVATQPGSLPLLEHALLELWSRRRGTLLTLEGYQDAGGVAGSLAQRAEEVYLGLPAEPQLAAKRILLRLTQPGEGTEDTRRRATSVELEEDGNAGAMSVIEALVTARLLTTGHDEETGEPTVEVAHEALIRAWPRLRSWLDEDRSGLRAHRRLTEAAIEWQRSDRDPDLLYRGTRLSEAESLAAQSPERLNAQEHAFLAESASQRDREIAAAEEHKRSREQLRRRVMAGLSLFSVLALVLASVAGWQWWEAGQQRTSAEEAQQRAESQRRIALSRQLAAQANSPRTGGFDRRLLLAVEANRLNPDGVDTRDSLFRLLQSSPELQRFVHDPQNLEMYHIRYTEDGRSLVAGTVHGEVLVWDVEQQQIMATIVPDDGWRFGHFAVSPDSRTLATLNIETSTGIAQSIRLLDIPTRQILRDIPVLDPTFDKITGRLVFSPDGQLLVRGRATRPQTARPAGVGQIEVWNVLDGQPVTEPIRAHGTGVWALDFSPDGAWLLSGGDDGNVQFWDTMTWEPAGTKLWTDSWINIARFSPDGRYVAAAGGWGTINVWEMDGLTEVGMRSIDEATEVIDLAFSADSTFLATTSETGMVNLIDLTEDELERRPLAEHASAVASVAFSPDSDQFASLGIDGTIAFWDATASSRLATTTNAPNMVALNPNGRFGVNADGTDVWISNTSSGETIATVQASRMTGYQILSQSGERLALLPGFGPIVIFDAMSGQMLGSLANDLSTQVSTVAFSQDDALIATGTQAGTVSLWDGRTFERIADLPGSHLNFVSYLLFHPDQPTLLSASWDGMVYVWDTDEHVQRASTRIGQPISALAFDPTNRQVAASSSVGNVYLLELDNISDIGSPLVAEGGWLSNVQFSPDGRLIAAGNGTGQIAIWDASTRMPIGDALSLEGRQVAWVAFSQDNRTLVSLSRVPEYWSGDGQLTIWAISTDDWVSVACDVANRNLSREEWSQFFGAEPYHETCPGLPIPVGYAATPTSDDSVASPVVQRP